MNVLQVWSDYQCAGCGAGVAALVQFGHGPGGAVPCCGRRECLEAVREAIAAQPEPI